MGLTWPGLWLKRLWVLVQVAVEVAMGKVLMTLFPERIKKSILAMGEKTGMTRNPQFSHDNWIPTFFSTQYFWFILKVRWQRLEETAELGGLAPDCSVVCLSGEKRTIWDFMHGQEPGAGFQRGMERWAGNSTAALPAAFWGFRVLGVLWDLVSLSGTSAFQPLKPQAIHCNPHPLEYHSYCEVCSAPTCVC